MIRLSSVPLSQCASSAGPGDDGKVVEVVAWLQEHTNLCMAIASAGAVDSDLQARLKERLAASADLGRQLVAALLAQKGTEFPAILSKLQEAAQNFVPVAGSARGRLASPLSGGVRRLEDVGALGTTPRQSARTGHAPASMAPTPASCSLLPSRTYIKKSGT